MDRPEAGYNRDAGIDVRTLGLEAADDIGQLFASDPVTEACWCMWHIVPVRDFHAAGAAGNRARFLEFLENSAEPLGLVGYRDGCPVGWCAVGPRRRYIRAVKTPTMRGRDPEEDASVWLAPCLFVRPDARHTGVSVALLEAASALATEHGAKAIEGFPLAGGRIRSNTAHGFGSGVEPLFIACGFSPVSRPSSNRVVVRRELGG